MNPVVEVRDLFFSYGEEMALERINLTVARGDFLALIGPNGSGKTTLIKLILGLLKPLSGEVRLFGVPVQRFHQWHRVGYVPQKATSFDVRFPATVEEVVLSGRFGLLGPGRRPGREDRRAVEEALELVGMGGAGHRIIGRLSGGQQQRVFIARALVGKPELLVLDEPVVGLDSRALDSFYSLLEHLNRDMGITLITVTHDTGTVARRVGRVACINKRLICHGTPSQVLTAANLARLYGAPVRRVVHSH
ncbi:MULTISPECIES: metal ABC transporter ATP-binding protein [Desulfofundulus]|jgi:zinc transport system ATP-binding protein|uniref:Polyamine-transporting ATPase n=1 Tax=Desulfofundulus kuznetsovii (strain DSM 6115 / VKM B-1805 / 17) TaxID=760568 RepID=A0AAU8PGZ3_DESK7|nr:ATP-binding cassette domain-containing protein [Desulfofundulus sp. TPOSR]AEG16926.1 Polyamine-transporting ATPase [Desulfofundulus kuznetsovii DSM 6115]